VNHRGSATIIVDPGADWRVDSVIKGCIQVPQRSRLRSPASLRQCHCQCIRPQHCCQDDPAFVVMQPVVSTHSTVLHLLPDSRYRMTAQGAPGRAAPIRMQCQWGWRCAEGRHSILRPPVSPPVFSASRTGRELAPKHRQLLMMLGRAE